MFTHFFNVSKITYDTIKDDNHTIIKFKALPKSGDEIVFQTEGEQKKTVIAEVNSDTTGLMKGYYFIHHTTAKK